MATPTFRERTSLVRLSETVESIRFNGTEQATLVATGTGHEIHSPGRGTSEMLGFDGGDAGRMDMAVQYLIDLDRRER